MDVKKILLLILLSASLSSCNPPPRNWNWDIKPRPLGGLKGVPSADTDYGKGFRDGCSAGLKTTSKGLLGDIKVHFDPEMISKNTDYSVGWSDAYQYCVDVMDWELP